MAGLFQSLFMPHSNPKTPKITAAPAAAPGARSTITGAGVAPGTSADQFKQNENAYYQQLLQGTGQGNQVPESIQNRIDQQAALIS